MLAIGLIEDLRSHRRAADESVSRESPELALHRPHTAADLPCDLAHVQRPVRAGIEQTEDRATRLPEEQVRQSSLFCSHNENNCTHYENAVKCSAPC